MRYIGYLSVALVAASVAGHASRAQGTQASTSAGAGTPTSVMRLNVVLSGGSAEGLQPSELRLLDNGSPANITTVQPMSRGSAPAHVILVLDDVNTGVTTIAYERDQLKRFFTKNEGQLPVPFTIAVMTDTKMDIQQGFSQDGNAENQALQRYQIGLHELRRDAQYGGVDRANIGVKSLEQLVQYASGIPGQKLILFLSPGWPLLSGPRINLSAKEQKGIFETATQLQDAMLRAGITLDMLNPFGPNESPLRSDYYQAFLKDARKPSDAQISDLSLQVLATHNGGVVQQGSNDIEGMVERSVADLNHSYTVGFAPVTGDSPNGYHSLKLEVSRPGVTVRMPDEYYTSQATTGQGSR